MPITSIKDRIEGLPLILCGPIVRRVEPDYFSVWIVTVKAVSAKLVIYSGNAFTSALGSPFIESQFFSSTKLGDFLFINLLHVSPGPTIFTPGALYSYNIVFDDGSDLGSLKLLEDFTDETTGHLHLALGYIVNKLPTIVMPPIDYKDLVIGHGSCRKAHGSDLDSLAGLDMYTETLIESDINGFKKRLSHLFLTGDQIYADDVPMLLLPFITDIANELVIKNEKIKVTKIKLSKEVIPEKDDSVCLNNTEQGEFENIAFTLLHQSPPFEFNVNLGTFPVERRGFILNEVAKFTAGRSLRCHLMSFGEYCSTYLMYWSNILWPPKKQLESYNTDEKILSFLNFPLQEDLPELLVYLDPDPTICIPGNYKLDKDGNKLKDDKGEFVRKKPINNPNSKINKFKNEHENVLTFYHSLPRIRRILANVSVLMQFDDHDVTDDWNLTLKWQQDVENNVLGKSIVRNALSAYSFFQAMGNRKFSGLNQTNDFIYFESLAAKLQEYSSNSINDSVLSEIHFFLNKIEWHFSLDISNIKAVVLNTRTEREFDSLESAPNLVRDLEYQFNDIPLNSSLPLLIISPVPVLGLPLMEQLGQPAVMRIQDLNSSKKLKNNLVSLKGNIEYDLEPWSANILGFETLLAKLATYSKVIILSGDVHYGFTGVMDYWNRNINGQGGTARILQLVSSASKNFISSSNIGTILSTGIGQRLTNNIPRPKARVRGKWQAEEINLSMNEKLRKLPPLLRYKLNTSPAEIPDHYWPDEFDVNTVFTNPDWVWTFDVLKDVRSNEIEDDNHLPDKILPTLIDENLEPKVLYTKVLERNEKFIQLGVNRTVVFKSNIGILTFVEEDDTVKAKHGFLYRLKEDELPDFYTVHLADLKKPNPEDWNLLNDET